MRKTSPETWTRQSLEESRLECLEAGRQILARRGLEAKDDVTVNEVAEYLTEHSGRRRTTGFVYQIWPGDQMGYNRDLAAYILHRDVIEAVVTVFEFSESGAPNANDPDATIRFGAELALTQQLNDPGFQYFIRYWSYATSDEAYTAEVRAAHDAYHHGVKALYAALMERFDLELVPPFTLDDVTVTIAALIDGFALRTKFDPDRNTIHEIDGHEWSLFASAIDAVARRFTRPQSGAGRSPGVVDG